MVDGSDGGSKGLSAAVIIIVVIGALLLVLGGVAVLGLVSVRRARVQAVDAEMRARDARRQAELHLHEARLRADATEGAPAATGTVACERLLERIVAWRLENPGAEFTMEALGSPPPKDPWGRSFLVELPSADDVIVTSVGPDGLHATPDDIRVTSR